MGKGYRICYLPPPVTLLLEWLQLRSGELVKAYQNDRPHRSLPHRTTPAAPPAARTTHQDAETDPDPGCISSESTYGVEVMRRYSNQAPLLERLQKLAESVVVEATVEKPVTSATPTPRVHKLDHRIDGELVARVMAEYEAGMPAAEIGALFALGKNSVLKVLREAGIEIRLPRMTEAEVGRAIALYQGGLSLVEVGRRLDRGHSTVYKALRRRGIAMRDSHGRVV